MNDSLSANLQCPPVFDEHGCRIGGKNSGVVKNTWFIFNTFVLAILPVIHIGPATHSYMKETNLSGDNHGQ
jgi:hypothetical protein